MDQIFSSTKNWTATHKLTSGIVVVLVLGGGWWAYSNATAASAETRYLLGTAQKGTVVASVSASGQVSASNQIDVTSKAAGDIVYLNARSGQEIKAGTLMAQIGASDASYELETAKLSYEKLITIDSSALTQAQEDVTDAYTNARATLIAASTDMADTMESLKEFFDCNTGYLGGCHGYSQGDVRKVYRDKAEASWYATDALLKELSKKSQTITKTSTGQEIESVTSDTYEAALAVAEAAKYTQDAVIYLRDHGDTGSKETAANAAYAAVTPLVSSANAIVSSITTTKNSITAATRALEDIKKGPDALDVRSSELAVRQKQAAVADYYVRAPFDGIIATVEAKAGQSVSNGAAIATLISKQKIAELSLNEVDAAKVSLGDKATLTYDAIDGLSLTGSVAEISSIGTVTQGVVSYTVKIAFDAQDSRVKPGMTVNAAIQTDVRQDVLVVPSSAIKTQGGVSYVQVFTPALSVTGGTQGVVSPTPPGQLEVTVGISDDTNVEILSGLEEGQQIVTRTISGTATANTPPSANTRGGLGGAGIRL